MGEGSPFELLTGRSRMTDSFAFFASDVPPTRGGKVLHLIPIRRHEELVLRGLVLPPHAPRFLVEESGRVIVKKPGRMRWEYQSPEEKLFVTDGSRSYFYIPIENQVMVSHHPRGAMGMGEGSPFELLTGRSRMTDSFAFFASDAPPTALLDGPSQDLALVALGELGLEAVQGVVVRLEPLHQNLYILFLRYRRGRCPENGHEQPEHSSIVHKVRSQRLK